MWDVRKLAPLHTYFSRAPATELAISQRGLLAVGSNRRVQVPGIPPLTVMHASTARTIANNPARCQGVRPPRVSAAHLG